MEQHVLILTTTHDFIRKFEMENVKLLQAMGCTVHFASNMKEPSYISEEELLKNQGIHTHHIEIARSPFLWKENRQALENLLEVIEKYQIRMIHCHTPVGGVLGRLAAHMFRRWPVFVIYTAHGFHFYKGAPLLNQVVYYRAERYLARYTDILITINEEDYRNACRFRLKKGGRVYKIPGVGIDRKRFRPLTKWEREANRQKLNISGDEFLLVSVGELNGNKNHELILETLSLLRQEKKLSGIRWLLCGDGFFREQLEEKIRRLHLEKNVTMLGHCPHVPEVLGCADASVFPSRREGLGMAGLESLAMGVPVIAADNRGTREYMEHGKNGFVCRYDDALGFAQGILFLKQLNSEKREAMETNCVQSVQPFDQKYAAAVMKRIYKEGKQVYERDRENQHHHERIQSNGQKAVL